MDWNALMRGSALGAGTLLKSTAGFRSGASARRAGDYNAGALEDRATLTEQQGEMDLAQFDRLARKLKGENVAEAAASGFTMSGSALDVMADVAAQLELERRIKQRDTDIQAQALRQQGAIERAEGRARGEQYDLSAWGDIAQGLYRFSDLFG